MINNYDSVGRQYTQTEKKKIIYGPIIPKDGSIICKILSASTSPYSVHRTPVTTRNGKTLYLVTDCIRPNGGDACACPLCASGAKVSNIAYVRMIVYSFDPNTGSLVAEPKTWERSAVWVKNNILPIINEYGEDLVNTVFKISRSGQGLDTVYTVTPLPPTKYPSSQYPTDCAVEFDDYDEYGTNIQVKSFDDIQTYVTTGSFPYGNASNPDTTPQSDTSNAQVDSLGFANINPNVDDMELPFGNQQKSVVTPASAPTPVQTPAFDKTTGTQEMYNIPTDAPVNNTQRQSTPWASNNSQQIARPRRQYT